MVTLGITGGFGTGKSTVAGFFREKGAKVLDADEIAHGLLKPGCIEYKKIVSRFGSDILDKDGRIDKARLSERAFAGKAALRRLNTIIHPAVIRRMKRELQKAERSGRHDVFAAEVPLLFEAGLENMFDRTIVVAADYKTQLKRCGQRSGLSIIKIDKRIKAQMPIIIKMCLADFVIDNNGKKSSTKKQMERVWQKVTRIAM